ncbi:hypothetical protein HPB47_015286 [Ixodes persulcatus]|uniref:Uncharacterized protein n=1 Tax=Ixodes persulcatus TaxID=34615 RepID=A0AC60QTX6_IXOPE|nr:hypothetical protein HPB47_015286 [Ixodes persulcatus]
MSHAARSSYAPLGAFCLVASVWYPRAVTLSSASMSHNFGVPLYVSSSRRSIWKRRLEAGGYWWFFAEKDLDALYNVECVLSEGNFKYNLKESHNPGQQHTLHAVVNDEAQPVVYAFMQTSDVHPYETLTCVRAAMASSGEQRCGEARPGPERSKQLVEQETSSPVLGWMLAKQHSPCGSEADSRLQEAGAKVVCCLARGAPKGPNLPRARLNHQDALFPGHGLATHSQTWEHSPGAKLLKMVPSRQLDPEATDTASEDGDEPELLPLPLTSVFQETYKNLPKDELEDILISVYDCLTISKDTRLREAGAEVVCCLTRGAPKGPNLPRVRLNHQDALFPGHGFATHSQTWAHPPFLSSTALILNYYPLLISCGFALQ